MIELRPTPLPQRCGRTILPDVIAAQDIGSPAVLAREEVRMESVNVEVLEELRTATRILVREGVLDGFGHVSVRSPTEPGGYFMLRSNSGEAMEPDRYVELTIDSEPVRQGGPRPSIERFIHGEVYRARPDVRAVVHTHSPARAAVGYSLIRSPAKIRTSTPVAFAFGASASTSKAIIMMRSGARYAI